jgi:hypothetical protein
MNQLTNNELAPLLTEVNINSYLSKSFNLILLIVKKSKL